MPSNTPRERRRRRKTSQEERICSICSQSFKKAEHLARHFRSHTKERPFTCNVCGKFYARQDTLLRHSRSHHPGSDPTGIGTGTPADDDGGMSMRRDDSLFDHTIIPPSPVQPPTPAQYVSNIPSEGHHSTIPEQLPQEYHCPPLHPDLGTATLSSFSPSSPPGFTEGCNDELTAATTTLLPDEINVATTPRVNRSNPWSALWNGQWDSDWTSWLAGTDFDLDAVNQSLLESTGPFPKESYNNSSSLSLVDPSLSLYTSNITTIPDSVGGSSSVPSTGLVQRRWHTFYETVVPSSGQTTPDRREQSGNSHSNSNNADPMIRTHSDEAYRHKLAESLRQRVQPGTLPSTGFLDFCVQAYFTHFHALFPLIHRPTFKPSRRNSVLLLSICSIGSLFLGSSRAMAHGISMFERLNKAILSSWDIHIAAAGSPSLIALQASLIGQTFGLLLGRPKDLAGIEMWHGCIVAWIRRIKLFHPQEEPDIQSILDLEDDSPALTEAWKTWVRLEEKKRIVLGIHIHDAELAKLHHHEPVLRHCIEKLPRLASPELFAAPDANTWRSLLSTTPGIVQDTSNQFYSYASLSCIAAMACEDRTKTGEKCHHLLITWYHEHLHSNSNLPGVGVGASLATQDPFCLMILWHASFMNLYANFNDLECACGREGESGRVAQGPRGYAADWAGSRDAIRTLLHAVLIQRHFQSVAVGCEPGVHVPMALYYCGIAWTSFTRFGGSHTTAAAAAAASTTNSVGAVQNNQGIDFPELRLLGIDQGKLFQEATRGIQWGRPESSPFFKIVDLLQKISHWKVAGSFAGTLLAFVEDVPDLF